MVNQNILINRDVFFNNGGGEQALTIQSEKLEEIFLTWPFVQQELGKPRLFLPSQPGAFNEGIVAECVLGCVGQTLQRGLIKGFLWRSDKADSRGQGAGPQTGCDPHTCLAALRRNMSAHSGHARTDTSLLNRGFTTHTDTGIGEKDRARGWYSAREMPLL